MLADLSGTKWSGSGELWLDPLGNEVAECEVTGEFTAETFTYQWSYEGEAQEGSFAFRDGSATWTDTWHQKNPVECAAMADEWGLITVQHDYSTPYGEWRWRSKFARRPDGSLIVQMTNIAPWGEEGRAVRMTLTES